MNPQQFSKLLTRRLAKIAGTLDLKSAEYAMGGDRLHNFKVAARIGNEPTAKALEGMMRKHLVSVYDLINGNLPNTEAMVDEKVGDLINYLCLLEAVFSEERNAAKSVVVDDEWEDSGK